MTWRLWRWICRNIRGLEGIREAREMISENRKRIEEDLWSDLRRSSPDMGIYGKWPGSVDLLGGVSSHNETHQIGLSDVGIVVP